MDPSPAIHRAGRAPRLHIRAALAAWKTLGLDTGDLGLAQLVHRWEGELLAMLGPADRAAVVDLAERRRGR